MTPTRPSTILLSCHRRLRGFGRARPGHQLHQRRGDNGHYHRLRAQELHNRPLVTFDISKRRSCWSPDSPQGRADNQQRCRLVQGSKFLAQRVFYRARAGSAGPDHVI